MKTKNSLLGSAALAVLLAGSLGVSANAAAKKHRAAAPAASAAEVDDLKAKVDFLTERLDEQAAVTRQALADLRAAQATAAQAQVTAATAQATANADATKIDTIPVAIKTAVAANAPKPSWADNTKFGTTVFADLSNISQSPTPSKVNGTGADIKRAYVSLDHTFNSIYSANLTFDLAPNGIVLNGGAFGAGTLQGSEAIKYAYVQAKFANELVVQAGSEQMPWIPFVENIYGYRFVDKVFVDQNKYGNSADWGLNAHGDLVKGLISYSVSVVDGAGYKNPVRSKTMDWEGRVNLNYQGFVAAIGGYSGQEGNNIQSVPTTALQTATRFDALLAYVKGPIRLGVEYMDATNWKVTTKVTPDKAQGYSAFASYALNPKWSVFGRYDAQDPSKTLAPSEKYAYYNIGINFEPVKTIDLALVYKHEDISHAPLGGYADGTTTLGPAGGSGKYDEIGIFTQVKY
jgi:hypothetical protein